MVKKIFIAIVSFLGLWSLLMYLNWSDSDTIQNGYFGFNEMFNLFKNSYVQSFGKHINETIEYIKNVTMDSVNVIQNPPSSFNIIDIVDWLSYIGKCLVSIVNMLGVYVFGIIKLVLDVCVDLVLFIYYTFDGAQNLNTNYKPFLDY